MSQAVTTREPLTAEVTEAQLYMLIAERKSAGAADVVVEAEGNRRVLVTTWPRL